MKKILCFLLIGAMVLGMAACSKKEDDKGSTTRNATEISGEGTQSSTGSESGAANYEATPTEGTETPTEEPVTVGPSATPTATPTPEPTEEPAAPTGPEISMLPDMQKVFDTYYEYARNCMDPEYTLFETMRFGLALIDDDDVPELLISDNDIHATGVKVIFYNNGTPVQVGEFGESGGFSYVKKENHIMSFFMNNGIRTLTRYHVNADLSVTKDIVFYCDDNNGKDYKIDEKEVDMETFDTEYNKAFESANGNKHISVQHLDLLQYNPYLCDPRMKDVFYQMYNELLDPEYTRFSGYTNENLEKLYGSWDLIRAEAHIIGREALFYNLNEKNDDGFMMCSSATASKRDGLGFWASAYINDEPLDTLTITSYAMPLLYSPNGISDGIDYGWNAQAIPEFSDWTMYACIDDEDHMILAMFRESEGKTDEYGYPLSDTMVLTYERNTETHEDVTEEQGEKRYLDLERKADADIDGKKAFLAKEYIWIFSSDTELIKKYGFPEDLGGYDYEIVYKEQDPFIIYADENTAITTLIFDPSLHHKDCDLETFCNLENYRSYVVYFDGVSENEDVSGKTAYKIYEDYTG